MTYTDAIIGTHRARETRESRRTASDPAASRWSVTSAEIARVEVVVAIVSPMLISGVAYPELL
jgi:hypothetical protein